MNTPKKKKMPTVNPENADQLWHALFAITHAVEHLDLAVDVNQFRNPELGLGAWEYARLVLQSSNMESDIH